MTSDVAHKKNISPVIKWSGSKRSQSQYIINMFPNQFGRYFEPFIGGGAVLYAADVRTAIAGDIFEPLVELWKLIQGNPEQLIAHYYKNWQRLQDEGFQVYYKIRDRFNSNWSPSDLFFLSRTCVNGLIRFNKKGEFNNSLHHTRSGIHPKRAEKIICDWSVKLFDVEFRAGDYVETTKDILAGDLVYLDPPYFHTKGRYFGTIDFEIFLDYLNTLNKKGVKFILSYHGRRGEKIYSTPLPKSLYKQKFLIPSGNSPFKKVMDKKTELVEEALYINW